MRTQSNEQLVVDSVIITETVRDTVISIAADSSMIRALLECDSLGQVHLREIMDYRYGHKIRPPALTIKDNLLTATTTVDSVSIFLTLKDRYKEKFHEESRAETTAVTANIINSWQRFRLTVADITLALLALFTLYKINKLIKP